MSFDARTVYELLPAIHRIRDAERNEPLKALLSIIAEQIAVLEEDLDQLYDDQFIETCAEWVTPYIGTLIGYRALHGVARDVSSARAEVANTISFRRRKGTATMLEQLARDVTDWPARAVEFFQLLATTQYMNHVRLAAPATADLRPWEPLEHVGTAFDSLPHTVDVRRIGHGGRFNIPNIGIFLWRLAANPLERAVAARIDDRRFTFSPLGNSAPLFTRPQLEEEISHLAEPINVPVLISRRALHERLATFYGADKSLLIHVDGNPVAATDVEACDLSDVGGGNWAHMNRAKIAIDPVLGRIAFPANLPAGADVRVTFHYGFAAFIGGGQYDRLQTFAEVGPGQAVIRVPDDRATIQDGLNAVQASGGIVEITDNRTYQETLTLRVPAKGFVELRARNERRPVIEGDVQIVVVGAAGDATVSLNGFVLAGGAVQCAAGQADGLARLQLGHVTLVPGRGLNLDGTPSDPAEPSIVIAIDNAIVEIDSSITGAVQINSDASCRVHVSRSIIDATDMTRPAYGGAGGTNGAELSLDGTTVIGRIRAEALGLVCNSILFAARAPADPPAVRPVQVLRKQSGCARFSFVPVTSVTPRRYRCQPDLAIADEIERREKQKGAPLSDVERVLVRDQIAFGLKPLFTALRYGHPAYAQLQQSCAGVVRRGADDESEMGAFHHLFQPQRETNVRIRLDEYLRFGLEAGIFFET